VEPQRIVLDETLESIGMTRNQLVDVALLVGTDYNPGIAGIGPKTAVKLVAEEGTLEAVLDRAARETKGAAWAKIREGAEGLEPIGTVRGIFLTPQVTKVGPPTWSPADPAAVRALLVDEFRFSRQRVDATLLKYGAGGTTRAQSSLGDF
jgi:flap endonuclease-1